MSRHRALIPLAILLLLALMQVSAAGQDGSMEKVFAKYEQLRQQYEDLHRRLLFPAGVSPDFNAFRLKNPNYFRDSYARSRTAAVITDLLKDKPDKLKVFEQCGLSRGGEYLCRNPHCPIHAASRGVRTARSVMATMDVVDAVKYLGAVVAGVILFVCVSTFGSPLCAWLDRKFRDGPEEKK